MGGRSQCKVLTKGNGNGSQWRYGRDWAWSILRECWRWGGWPWEYGGDWVRVFIDQTEVRAWSGAPPLSHGAMSSAFSGEFLPMIMAHPESLSSRDTVTSASTFLPIQLLLGGLTLPTTGDHTEQHAPTFILGALAQQRAPRYRCCTLLSIYPELALHHSPLLHFWLCIGGRHFWTLCPLNHPVATSYQATVGLRILDSPSSFLHATSHQYWCLGSIHVRRKSINMSDYWFS